MKLLVTGSNGLIGSEVCVYFGSRKWNIHGLDNNQRAVFFGPEGDTITEWTPSPDSPQGRRIALVADQLDGALITPEAVEELGIWDATDPSMEALDRIIELGLTDEE